MVTRAEVIAEARAWIGTRWQHQADVKGVACDCAGLVRGVAIELGLFPAGYRTLADAIPYLGYAPRANGTELIAACETFMKRIDKKTMQPGDIAIIRWESETPQHLAIVGDHTSGLSFIHSYARARKVIEHRIDEIWRARVFACYQLIGVA